MRRLIGLVFLLGIFLSLLLVVVSTLSAALGISDNYALQTPGCAQPCWHTIQLGTTRVDDALKSLRADPLVTDLVRNDPSNVYPCELEFKMVAIPLFTGCVVIEPGKPANSVILRFSDEQIRLGEVMAVFGRPTFAQLCYRYDFGLRFRESVFATVYFPNNIIVVAYQPIPELWRIDPAMYVKMVRYEALSDKLILPEDGERWHGFAAGKADGSCDY